MKSDMKPLTIPLILLVMFNQLPSFYLRPLWATIFCAVLLAYRLWLAVTSSKMPPRWILLIGQITAALVVWQHYFTFLGDEAAGCFLSLLSCIKLFELKRKRDYFVAVILCFLVLMSFLLLDQSLLLTIFLLINVTALLTFLFALEAERFQWSGWGIAVRPGLTLTIKALPLMVLIFILFPRFSTGFGAGSNNKGRMGVSDSLKPGSVASLIGSDELVFRATFLEGNLPPRQGLYWRGAILDISHGLNWDRTRTEFVQPVYTMSREGDIEVYLEPGNDRFLFSLDNTETLNFPNDINRSRLTQRPGGIYELDHPLQTRERYVILSGNQRPSETGNPTRYLGTDAEISPKLKALAKKMRQDTTLKSVHEVLQHYRTGGFSYSLQPPTSNTMDEFMFQHKTGFCEHFAGSMATLLRLMEIPARVVVGFQGGTPSLLDNFISVRAHDAHAWVEFYDVESKRWKRVDPTAEVEPERISQGSALYLENSESYLPSEWNRIFFRSRALFDEIDARWIGFLVRFDLARQQDILAQMGMEGVLFRALPLFLILAIVLVLAVLYFFESRRREPMTESDRLNVQLLRVLRRHKFERRPNEGPMQFWQRIRSSHAELGAALEPIYSEVTAIRYGDRSPSKEERASLLRRVRALKKLSIKTPAH